MFVDDDLNIVPLHLYHHPVNGVPVPVSIPPSGAYPKNDNPLLDAMQQALRASNDVWTKFTNEVVDALNRRRQLLIKRFHLTSVA